MAKTIEVPNWVAAFWGVVTLPKRLVVQSRRSKRLLRLVTKWNNDVEDIERWIDETTTQKDPRFMWVQILWQELERWVWHGQPVTQEEFVEMAARRGFTVQQQGYASSVLRYMGLWGG